MNLDRLQELKTRLVQKTDFSDIWSFYMDEFADHPEFLEVGHPVTNAFLEAAIPQICKQMFGKAVKITDLLIICIAEYQFFHAPLQVEGRIGGVIYFADIHTGLLAVSAQFPTTDEVKYSRFSGPPQLQHPSPYEYN
ncbi:MAG: hypothetical protein WCD18_16885 [Thermosynechococcaceae cyanobacterium]